MSLLIPGDTDAARAASMMNFWTETYLHIDWNAIGPLCFIALLVLGLAYWKRGELSWYLKNNFISRWRERRRMRAEREKFIRELTSDYITDALEEAYFQEEITSEEKKELYRRIGKLGYPDLLKKGELMLKEEIAKRRAEENRDAKGNVIPAKLPDGEGQTRDITVVHVHSL